ncbi:unnamed protein product [Trichobilharzia regenti]|nr:unnamed protein product [Trichobilharzia regenti]
MELTGSFLISTSFLTEETTVQPGGPAPTPAEKTLTRLILTINDENLNYFQNSLNNCKLTIEDVIKFVDHITPSWSKC